MPDTAQRDVEPHALPPAREEWRIPADPLRVPTIRRGVRRFAEALGAPEPCLANLSLAVTEAVTNAVLHAYVDLDPGEVTVLAQAAPDELIVAVLDDGRGMQPRPDSPGLGMGLPMIGQLTTSVDIRERVGGGTEVRMRIAAPGVRGPAQRAEGDHRMQLLAEVARLARTGGWPETGVSRLVELLVPAVADACRLEQLTDEGIRLLAERGPEPPALGELSASGEVQVLPGTGSGVIRWVVVPLRDTDRALGVLRLGLGVDRPAPEPEDLVFWEALGERAARGLASSQLVADLARTRRRLERVLDHLAEAVTVQDEHGRTVYANRAAAELLGVGSVEDVLASAPGELAARFIITLEDGSPVGRDELPGARLIAGRDADSLLTRSVMRSTGQERWLLTKATLLEDGDRLAVNIIEDVTEAKRAELRARFLAHAGEVLHASLDIDRILSDLSDLLVPHLADYCAVALLEDGALRRVAVSHANPDRLALAEEVERRYPMAPDPSPATEAILAGGGALLISEVTDDMLAGGARDEVHLALLRQAGMRSVVLLPMRVADRTIGVLTMISADSARTFTQDDVTFGEDVARRAAVAVENARLYAERG